jgi:hypothetical protein
MQIHEDMRGFSENDVNAKGLVFVGAKRSWLPDFEERNGDQAGRLASEAVAHEPSHGAAAAVPRSLNGVLAI